MKNAELLGKPGIILSRYKTVIFVHGCFWHRHKGCRYAYNTKSKVEFWQHRFDSNVHRDQQVAEQVRKLGWHHITLWEYEINNTQTFKEKIKVFFSDIK